MKLLEQLRDVARAAGDFDGYITYNEQMTTLNEEIRGKEAALKVTMQEAEREIVKERQERERERAILYSTLPPHIADRIIRGEDVSGDHHERAAVLFLDIVWFTTHTSSIEPQQTSRLLATIFDHLDKICRDNGVTKVKTIGDSYMAVAFTDAQGAESTEQRAQSREQRVQL